MRDRNKAGLNIVKWDLRVQPLRPLPPPPGAPAGGGRVAVAAAAAVWRRRQQRAVRAAGHLPGDAERQRPRRADDGRRREGRSADPDHRRRSQHLARHRRAICTSCRRRPTTSPRWCRTRSRRCTLLQQQTRKGQTLSPNAKQQLETLVKEFEARAPPARPAASRGGGGGFGGNTENVRGRIGQLKGQVMAVDRRCRPTRR